MDDQRRQIMYVETVGDRLYCWVNDEAYAEAIDKHEHQMLEFQSRLIRLNMEKCEREILKKKEKK